MGWASSAWWWCKSLFLPLRALLPLRLEPGCPRNFVGTSQNHAGVQKGSSENQERKAHTLKIILGTQAGCPWDPPVEQTGVYRPVSQNFCCLR